MYLLTCLLTYLPMALHDARCNWNKLSVCRGLNSEMFRILSGLMMCMHASRWISRTGDRVRRSAFNSGPEVLFQDLRRDEIRGWWWWWWVSSVIHDCRRLEVAISRLDRNVNIIIIIGVVVVVIEWLRVWRLAIFHFHLMTLGKLFTQQLD